MTKDQPQERPPMLDENRIGAGVFSNIANVSISPREVFIDFGLASPELIAGSQKVTLMSRVILTKEHAMELRDVLSQSLEKYAA